jgi:plastocyanin
MKRNTQLLFAAVITVVALAVVPLAAAATAQRTATTTVRVKAGEMYFKLSTKVLAKPDAVTFAVTNAGHLVDNFKINGKDHVDASAGQDGQAGRDLHEEGSLPIRVHRPRPCRRGNEGHLHRPLIKAGCLRPGSPRPEHRPCAQNSVLACDTTELNGKIEFEQPTQRGPG